MFSKEVILVVFTILILTESSDSVIELTTSADASDYRIVCYYGSWAASRTGLGRFTPEDIDPFLCTTLLYAFASITKNITFEPFNKVLDIEQGGYAKFTGLKQFNKKLKTSLSLGGWNEGSVKFASIAADSIKRSIFIINCIEFLRKHNFDGLDLDWQFPELKDRHSYSSLIKELREGFEIEAKARGVPRLQLSITLPILVDHITKGYDIVAITKYVDSMHALTYNYHTEFEPIINHHSALYGVDNVLDYEVNANYTISSYLSSGAENRKVILGIPTYGKVYNLSDPNLTDIGSRAGGPGVQGEQTQTSGFLAYYEICRKIKDDGWTVKQPYPSALGPYAYKGNQWVSYDDENIIRKKSEYVASHGLGGIMFWLIEYDDYHGYCTGIRFPLIEAAKERLLNSPKYIGNDNAKIAETTPELLPIFTSELKSEPKNHIQPVSTSKRTPGIVLKSLPHTTTELNENKYDDEIVVLETDDEKYNENTEILQQLQNFIRTPDGLARLKTFLNNKETITYRKETLNASPTEKLINKQTYKPESDPNLRNDLSQLFGAEDSKQSRILNVLFNVNI